MKKPTLVALVFISVFLFLSGLSCYWILNDLSRQKKIQAAKTDLKRLGKASQLVSQRNTTLDRKDFWEKIGMTAPMKDPWGNPYSERTLERAGAIVSGWASAGPNGVVGDADDLFEPYLKVESFDFTRPDLHSPEKATSAQ